jgi:ferric-dicitrate binding protein FerR (iron transport regulator)
MNPDEFQRLSDAWVAGEISPEDLHRLDAFLASDEGLAEQLAAQRSIDTQLRVLLDSENAERRIIASVLALLRARSSEQFQSDFMREMTRRAAPARVPTRISKGRNILDRRAFLAWSFAAAACLLFFVWWALPEPKLDIRLTDVSGEVTVSRGASLFSAGAVKELRVGDIIETGTGGAALAYLHESTRMTLKGNTVIRLASPRHGKRFELRRGEVVARVAKQPSGRPMVFVTAKANATVVGTTLSLAARRASTWLEVGEGAVDLAPRDGRASIRVGAGQCAMAASGLELSARPVTSEGNPRSPWPVKIPLFSDYVENSTWYIADDSIRQTPVGTAERPFKMPPLEGSVQFETTARIDEVTPEQTPGEGSWGFGFIASFRMKSDTPSPNPTEPRQVIEFDTYQNGTDGSLLRIVDPLTWRVFASIPFPLPRLGTYRLKIRIDPGLGSETGVVRGKIWQGSTEPEAWMLRAEIPIQGPLSYVALSTHRSACTFTGLKAGLVE